MNAYNWLFYVCGCIEVESKSMMTIATCRRRKIWWPTSRRKKKPCSNTPTTPLPIRRWDPILSVTSCQWSSMVSVNSIYHLSVYACLPCCAWIQIWIKKVACMHVVTQGNRNLSETDRARGMTSRSWLRYVRMRLLRQITLSGNNRLWPLSTRPLICLFVSLLTNTH